MLLNGLASGEPIDITPEYWEQKRRKLVACMGLGVARTFLAVLLLCGEPKLLQFGSWPRNGCMGHVREVLTAFRIGFRSQEGSPDQRDGGKSAEFFGVLRGRGTGRRISGQELGAMNSSPSAHFPGVLNALTRLQIQYLVIEAQSPAEIALVDWVERAFPWGFSQIDWARVPSGRCTKWTELDNLVAAFKELVSAFDASTPVVVMWANGLCPSLAMRLGDVKLTAREIFEEHETSMDVLVFCQADGWLLEMHHEGTLCLGRAEPDSHKLCRLS